MKQFPKADSGGSRNFKIGRRGPGAVEFLGLGFVLRPLHTYAYPMFFVVREVNKIHIINIVCWLKSKYIRVIQSNFTKTTPIFFRTGGGGVPGAPVVNPPLADVKFLVYQCDPRHLQGRRDGFIFVNIMNFVFYLMIDWLDRVLRRIGNISAM